MNSNPVFDTVKELLSLGDTEQALQVLIHFLEKSGAPPAYVRTIRVVEANYNATKQQEQKGILDFSEARREYARSNDAVLSVLEDLIAGRNPSPGSSSGTGDGGRSKTRLNWLVGGGILILFGIGTGIYFSQKTGNDPGQKSETQDCPKFRPEGFKIMVLEFQKLSGEVSNPESGIQMRIRDLTERNKVNTDVRILPAKSFDGATPDTQEATRLGSQCQADMVIWGQYEKDKDSIVVDIRYAFTDPKWPAGIAIQTFKNVSELKADQMKITNLDEAVFRLCTAMALRQNRIDLAEKWLNKLQQPNAREMEWKKVLQEGR